MAVDHRHNIHSVAYFIWDNHSVYYLMGGSNPSLRNSGAASLLMWEGIIFAIKNNKQFNFEGSMHEHIERFFRAFGAEQTPYYKISKINSPLIKLKNFIFN